MVRSAFGYTITALVVFIFLSSCKKLDKDNPVKVYIKAHVPYDNTPIPHVKYTIQGIGLQKAAKIVFRAEVFNNGGDLYFLEFRNRTIQSAKELFGSCSDELKSTIDAWYAVGVGLSVGEMNALFLSAPVGDFESDYQYALGNLTSIATLAPNSNVTYESSTTIHLKPGFQANHGSDFHAQIIPCTTGYARIAKSAPTNSSISTLDEQKATGIYPYPNPLKNKLNLKNDTDIEFQTFELLDITGTVKYKNSINLLENVPVEDLPAGIYILRLINGETIVTKKLQKL